MACPPSPAVATARAPVATGAAPPVTSPRAPPAAGAEGAKSSSALVEEEEDPAAVGAPRDTGWEEDVVVDLRDQRSSL